MLKSQIVTQNDLKEAATLQKRQRYEEERKARIFNAKQRLFGQDYEYLERQIQEKNKVRQIKAEIDRKENEEILRRAEIINAKEKEQNKERKKFQTEINLYRCQYQRKEDRREFDINDPDFLRKSQPARGADTDIRLGISSAQIFAGEDMMGVFRKKAQKEQQRSWLEQQIREKKQAEQDRNKADYLIQKAMEARDKLTVEQATIEKNNQIKMQNDILDFNRQLAIERDIQNKTEKKHSEEDNLAEIYNMLTSDMLTENPNVANSPSDINKKVAYLYRGLSPKKLEHFKREQFKQVEANKKKKTEEKLIEKLWEQQDINLTRNVMLKNKEIDRQAKIRFGQLMDENKSLAEEQKIRKAYLDKNLYTNKASDEFYEQFNKTSR